MSKLKILILEDDVIQSAALKRMITNMGYEVVGTAVSGERALQIFRETAPDIAILDINVKGNMDGIELGKIINQERKIPIIYLTAYPSAYERAKMTHPSAFFSKPYNEGDLSNAIDLAIHNSAKSMDNKDEEGGSGKAFPNIYFSQDSIWVKLKTGEPFFKLPIEAIIFLKASNVYLEIYTTKRPACFVLTLGLSDFVKHATYPQLIQTHRSYVVNVKYIEQFTNTVLTVKNTQEKEIPVSSTYLQTVLSALKNV